MTEDYLELKAEIYRACREPMWEFIGKFNDKITRGQALTVVYNIMLNQFHHKMRDWVVECDENCNSAELVDENKLAVRVKFQPKGTYDTQTIQMVLAPRPVRWSPQDDEFPPLDLVLNKKNTSSTINQDYT